MLTSPQKMKSMLHAFGFIHPDTPCLFSVFIVSFTQTFWHFIKLLMNSIHIRFYRCGFYIFCSRYFLRIWAHITLIRAKYALLNFIHIKRWLRMYACSFNVSYTMHWAKITMNSFAIIIINAKYYSMLPCSRISSCESVKKPISESSLI